MTPPALSLRILPPSITQSCRKDTKLGIYAREAVPHLWLLNPDTRTLEVLRLQGQQWLVVAVHAGESKVRAEPFDAVELDLGGLWDLSGSSRPE